MQNRLDLPNGYYELPPDRMANVVTCLEMTERPESRRPDTGEVALRQYTESDLDKYRELFRRVGEPWLWFSRLMMPAAELRARLRDPRVYFGALECEGESAGLLELDFRQPGECEIVSFGLVPGLMGRGLGRHLMDSALALAWRPEVTRVWLHTCTFDSPQAIPFYLRSGFRAYARMIEIHDDPRLTGKLPRTAASHIPIIEARA